jgi:hypothetical protein
MKELSIKERELLGKDLSSRLPYGVICQCCHEEFTADDEEPFALVYDEKLSMENGSFIGSFNYNIDKIRPYLRPMSSMTEEEKKELWELLKKLGMASDIKRLDWLTAHHFDYRGLIEKGLALEAPKGMYN